MSLEQEEKPADNIITVVFRDKKRMSVDLDVFPSETLRAIKRSKFADRDEVELQFQSEEFMHIYNEYKPINARDYLQMHEHEIKLVDVVFVVTATWWASSCGLADFEAYGKAKFLRGRRAVLCNITIPKVQISGFDDADIFPALLCMEFDMNYEKEDTHAHGQLMLEYNLDKEFITACSSEPDISKGLKGLLGEGFRAESEKTPQSIKLREWLRFHMME
jgi:hypothetical protein